MLQSRTTVSLWECWDSDVTSKPREICKEEGYEGECVCM